MDEPPPHCTDTFAYIHGRTYIYTKNTYTHIHPQLHINTHLSPTVPCWHLFRRRRAHLFNAPTSPTRPARCEARQAATLRVPQPCPARGTPPTESPRSRPVRPGPAPLRSRCYPLRAARPSVHNADGSAEVPVPESYLRRGTASATASLEILTAVLQWTSSTPQTSLLPALVGHRDRTPPFLPP